MSDSSLVLPRSKSLHYKSKANGTSSDRSNTPIITIDKSETMDTKMTINSQDLPSRQHSNTTPQENTVNSSIPQPAPPTKSESTGFLSTLLSAAANKISSGTSSSIDGETPKKKDHQFSNKLDTWLKTSSRSDIDPEKTADEDQMSLNELPGKSGNEAISIRSAQGVQFESVRESPLNTLGHGELSLNDFEIQQQQQDLENHSNIPSRHNSTQNGITKRELSPSIANSGGLSPSITSDVKRVHRKSITSNTVAGTGVSGTLSPVANGRRRAQSLDSNYANANGGSKNQPQSNLDKTKSEEMEDFEIYDSSITEQDEIDHIIDGSKTIKHASKKRNKEFHQVFKKLPSKEQLIDDFSCAVSNDILVQGKMYLSDHYICFNSNILGWVTNVLIPLQEVIQIEKKSTAGLFPNGMIIRTLHHKYVFATFLSRDNTFELITNVWHRVLLENSDVDPRKSARRNRADTKSSNVLSNYEETTGVLDDYLNGDDELDDDGLSELGSSELARDERDILSLDAVNREDQELDLDPKPETTATADMANTSEEDSKNFKGLPIVGPHSHAPSESNYNKSPGDVFIVEEIFKVPPGVIYQLLFGPPETSKFISILKDQKNFEITESSILGLDSKNKSRNYTYIKPLNGPIGPKQTKCIIGDKLIEYNPEKYYEIEQATQTPDVPSGNSFKIKTRFFLTWAENNNCKMYVVTNIEWSGKSWIKGAIEKGSIDGQKESMKILIESLNSAITAASGDKRVGKRKSTRARKSTIVKREKPEEEQEKLDVQVSEKSIIDKFSDLAESLGKLLPIPFLSSSIVGLGMIFIGLMVTLSVFNRLSGGNQQQYKVVEYMPSTSYTGRIRINDQEFVVISSPSIHTNLNSPEKIRQQEISIWSWLNERSDGKVKVNLQDQHPSSRLAKKYSQEELKELVRLTQLKLDQLSKELKGGI
ncbi:Membrane-anchored lipid-binding protein YSP2 [Spathaspora sp. JA1]|nr:Membrane-anchored lipid-binding protein YSP2 [Spathaspora sp. JA1]